YLGWIRNGFPVLIDSPARRDILAFFLVLKDFAQGYIRSSHIENERLACFGWYSIGDWVRSEERFLAAKRNDDFIRMGHCDSNHVLLSSFLDKIAQCAAMAAVNRSHHANTVFLRHFDRLFHRNICN